MASGCTGRKRAKYPNLSRLILITTTPHKYEYTVDLDADTAAARVARLVGQGKRVLEVGSGPGSITRLLCELHNCRVTALEIDENAISKVSPYCVQVHQADLNDGSWPILLGPEHFDVVVATDVLEHLYTPLSTLEAMGRLVNENGYLVISLPHVGHASVVACLLDEDFEYRDWGLLDRTHIRFFGIKNMQTLFETAGLKIVDAEFVVRHPEETELARHWAALSGDVHAGLLSNPFGRVYQVVIKAVPVDRPSQAVSLLSMKVEQTKCPQRARWKVMIENNIRKFFGRGIIQFINRWTGLRF